MNRMPDHANRVDTAKIAMRFLKRALDDHRERARTLNDHVSWTEPPARRGEVPVTTSVEGDALAVAEFAMAYGYFARLVEEGER